MCPDPGLQDRPVAWNVAGRVNMQRALNLVPVAEARREDPVQHRLDWDLPTLAAFLPPNLSFFFWRKGLACLAGHPG